VEGSFHANNQLDSFNRFDRTSACDRQMDGHTTTANTALAQRRALKSVTYLLHVDRNPVEESVRMTEDRDKWKKYVRGVANPRIEDG